MGLQPFSRRSFPPGLAVLAIALLGAAPAGAAPPWLPPGKIGHLRNQAFHVTPQIAVDSAGEAVAVWSRSYWNLKNDEVSQVLQSASRPPGGAWSAPVALTKRTGFIGIPRIAVENGEAVAVWERFANSGFVIEASSRRSGGAWSRPTVLTKRGKGSYAPRVTVSGSGEAIALWESFTRKRAIIVSASRPPRGAWSTPTVLSSKKRNVPASQSAQYAQLAVNASGEAIAAWVWRRSKESFAGTIESASRSAAGTWSAPMILTDKEGVNVDPHLAIDSAGEAVAVWSRLGYADHRAIESASLPPGGAWSNPVTLADTGGTEGVLLDSPRVVVASSGEAVAVWERYREGDLLESATRSPAGSWSAPAIIADTEELIDAPWLAMNDAGEAVAIWHQSHRGLGPDSPSIQSAFRPPGGPWSTPTVVIAKRGLFSSFSEIDEQGVAIDGAGNAVAIWNRYPGNASLIESASRPASG